MRITWRPRALSDDDRLGLDIAGQLTFGAKPKYLSFLYVLFYIHSAGGYELLESMEGGAQQDRIVGGTQAVPMKMAEELGSLVRLSQPVSQIVGWSGVGPIKLETPSGAVEARAVILALSPSQATGIRFSPELPADRNALMEHWPRGSHAIKIGVAYETPFWRAKGLSGQVYSPDGPFLWGMDVSPADASKGQLMSFTLSAEVPPRTSEQRKTQILDAYAKCLGDEARAPIGYVEHDWSQEDFTRGCVSPLAPGILTGHGNALRPPNGRLIWAGTETSQIWMGYMDGAVRAGKNAALEALRSLAEHLMNDQRSSRRFATWCAIAMGVGTCVSIYAVDATETTSAAEAATYARVKPILDRNCGICHSARPTMPSYAKAPDGVTFDSAMDLARYAARVLVMATKTDQMPPGNMTGMTEADRATLAAAIEAQWPAAR